MFFHEVLNHTLMYMADDRLFHRVAEHHEVRGHVSDDGGEFDGPREGPVAGVVDSIGWGISQKDGSTGTDMLPQVSATFEWIRLAQRVPVRVHLVDVPEEINLRIGTTCSVLVRKGSAAGP